MGLLCFLNLEAMVGHLTSNLTSTTNQIPTILAFPFLGYHLFALSFFPYSHHHRPVLPPLSDPIKL